MPTPKKTQSLPAPIVDWSKTEAQAPAPGVWGDLEINVPSGTPKLQSPIGSGPSATEKLYAQALEQAQQKQRFTEKVAPYTAGLEAASRVQPTTSSESAVLQTVGATATGAASGAMVGGPVGAVVGGLIGLVGGGIQAYTGLKDARAQKREQERLYQEITEREERRYRQARADQNEQQAYNRRIAALQSQWAAIQGAGAKLQNLAAEDESIKNLFLQRTY